MIATAPAVPTVAPDPTRSVRLWLWVVVAMIGAVVVVGGATRLTDSGLSITEWQPLVGVIPPLTQADWEAVFAKYRLIPEYRIVNAGMTLEGFKTIFWWEWGHRFLARAVGVVFAVPLVVFWARGRIPRGWRAALVGLFGLGGLQGALGWYMVKSGLAERVDVSQYRLAAHLGLAFSILGAAAWIAMAMAPAKVRGPVLATTSIGQRRVAFALLALVFLQVILGAFVAGMRAGLAHNTWPLMDGQWLPAGLGAMSPWWANLFENALTVQFDHRMVAYLIAVMTVVHAWMVGRVSDDPAFVASARLLVLAVLVQIALGIWTLLWHVPLGLGLVHQGFAVVLLLLAVRHARLARLTS